MTKVVFQNIMGKPVGESINLDRRRRRLSTIAKQHARQGVPYIVSKHEIEDPWIPDNQTTIMRSKWKDTLVKDEVVCITYLPLGGGGGSGGQGKQIGMALASIALLALGQFWAAPALAAATGISAGMATSLVSLATAGIVAGAQYLMARAQQAKAKKEEKAETFSVTGGGNLPRAGERIPRRYGRQVVTDADLTQPDYIVNEGEDQILYKRMTVGLGHYTYHKVDVGKSTMWVSGSGIQPAFEGAQIEFVAPGEKSSLVPATVINNTDVSGIELTRTGENPDWTGPFMVEIPEEGGKIQVNFTVPQVWASSEKNGKRLEHIYAGIWQYATCNEDGVRIGSWQTLHAASDGPMDTTTPIRKTVYKADGPGFYLVRAQNQQAKNDYWNDSIVWDSLGVHTNQKIVRPHVSEICMRVRSGKNLGVTAFADVSFECSARLEVWNGTTYQLTTTTKAVDAYVDVLRGWCGGIQYGAGLPDSEIDLAKIFYYRNAITDYPDFNGTIRGPVSVFEAAATVLGVIRAEPIRVGNAWSMTRDEPRQVTKRHVFTRRQILKGSTSTNFQVAVSSGMADIIGEYNPGGDRRKRRSVRYTYGVRTNTPTRIDLTGITSYEHAQQYVKWLAAVAFYRRRKRSVAVELSGRLVKRNDPAIIDAYFLSSSARGAGVLSRSGTTITLDSDMEFTGESYALFRDRKNQQWGPINVTRHATQKNVIIADAADIAASEAYFGQSFASVFANDNEDMTSVLVGPIETVEAPFIIQSVEHQSRDRIGIVAIEDNPMVWQVLAEPLPPPPPGIDLKDLLTPPLPNIPWLRALPVQRSTGIEMEWSVGEVRDASQYVVRLSYDNWQTSELVSNSLRTEGTYTLKVKPNVAEREVKVRAYAVNSQGIIGVTREMAFTSFKPVIDSTIAQIILDMEMLSAQLKKDIRAGYELGAGTIRDALKKMGEKVDELANATATEATNSYEQRNLIKVAVDNAYSAVLQEAKLRADADSAAADLITSLTSVIEDPESGLQAASSLIDSLSTAVGLTGEGATATASKITALETQLTGPDGEGGVARAVENLSTAVGLTGDGVTATASKVTALEVSVNGTGAPNTGLLSQYSTLRGDANGIMGRWGVSFAVNGNAVGGYEMTAISKLDGSQSVQFGISGNLLVTGTMTGDKLVTNSAIITGQLQVGSLVVANSAIVDNAVSYSEGSSDNDGSAQVTITVRAGSRVAVWAWFQGGSGPYLQSQVGTFELERRTGTGSYVTLRSMGNNFMLDQQNGRYVLGTSILEADTAPTSTVTRTYRCTAFWAGQTQGNVSIIAMELNK